LRYCPPEEWGKLLGLDRIPEARTLRNKVQLLMKNGQAQQWGGPLSRDWMTMFPETTGVLYVDGHGRVYTTAARRNNTGLILPGSNCASAPPPTTG